MEKKSIGYYLKNYGDAVWFVLMTTMCILDIYVLSIDWNVLSLIGAILCGISAIMSLVSLIIKIVYRNS